MRSRVSFLAALLMFTAMLAGIPPSRAEEWGPWSVSGNFPVLSAKGDAFPSEKAVSQEALGISESALVALVRVYQVYISPVYGNRCPMHPTCSNYSIEAINKHGSLVGFVMTVGRLLHESDERQFVSQQKVGDRYRFMDPVSNNDFWFTVR